MKDEVKKENIYYRVKQGSLLQDYRREIGGFTERDVLGFDTLLEAGVCILYRLSLIHRNLDISAIHNGNYRATQGGLF